MATVRDFYTGDGTTVLFSLSFEYLDQDDILVTVNNVPTTAFGFVNASTIQFSVAPANGADIAIIRQTPVDDPKAVFFAGSPIRAADLNQNNTQLLYVAQETSQLSDDANINSNLAITTANGAVATANTAEANSLTAISTANTAESNSLAAVATANTAESNSLAAVSTANAATVTAGNAVSTANSAVSTANGAVVTANAASSTANQAAIDAAAAVVTANAADVKADAAVLTANAADANASAAVITANAADVNASAAVVTANTAESNSLSAISTANSAAAAVAAAVLYQPVVDLAALALLTPLDGEFFELQDSTGADTDPSITGVPVGLVGAAGLTFRLRYDDPPGEYVFLGYFANDSETRYLKTGTGTVTSTNILDGTIVNADVNASAAIAGTKITPDFGSQALTTTGLISANGKVSFPLGTAALPSLYPGTDTNTGLYSPGADQVAISTNGVGRLFITSDGRVGINDSNPAGANLDVLGFGGNIRVASSAIDNGLKFGRLILRPYANANNNTYIVGGLNSATDNEVLIGGGSSELNQATVIKFCTAANSNTTGTTERMRLDSTGRLGLGTSSPGTPMEIRKDLNGQIVDSLTLSNLAGGANEGSAIVFASGGASGAKIIGSRDGTTGHRIRFQTASTHNGTPADRLTITKDGLVGIGTTSPNESLEVAGNIHVSGADRSIFNRSNNALTFGTNNAERARIDSSGRLLVGTSTARSSFYNTTHSAQSQVEISPAAAYSAAASYIYSKNDTGGGEILLGKSRGGIGSNNIVAINDTIGGISFQATDGTGFVESAAIRAFVDGTPGADDMPGRLVFSTTADGASSPTEQMRITNAGELRFNSGYGSAAAAYGCRAWVNFNGTGTVAIRASGNVSSITDNGVGNYTVNFTNALADADYSVTATTTTRNALTATTVAEIYDTGTPSINTGSVIVTTSEVSAGLNRSPVDRPVVSVAIFR